MKRFSFVVVMILAVTIMSNLAYAGNSITESPNIKIIIYGKLCSFKAKPITINGKLLFSSMEFIPMFDTSKEKGQISFNQKDSSMIIKRNKTQISLKVGSNKVKVNNTFSTLDTLPVKYKNVVYIPAQFITEQLGLKYKINKEKSVVAIYDDGNFKKIKDIITKADLILNEDKYKLDIAVNDNTDSENITNSLENNQIDSKNKILYGISHDLLNNNKKLSESLFYNKTLYIYFNFKAAWGKTVVDDKDFEDTFNMNDGTLMDSPFNITDFSMLNITDGPNNTLIIDGYIKSMEPVINPDVTYIKVNIDKNSSQYNEVYVSTTQKSDDTKKVEKHYKYSEYNGNFEVYIPSDLP